MQVIKCNHCNYTSVYKYNVKRHQLVHQKDNPKNISNDSNDYQHVNSTSTEHSSTPYQSIRNGFLPNDQSCTGSQVINLGNGHLPNDQSCTGSQAINLANNVQLSPSSNQAVNLSNNVQVPPTTNQIINIQPPSSSSTSNSISQQPFHFNKNKKPMMHNENNQYYDIRLKENFKIFISGPSRSGKTVFVKDLIQNIDIFCKKTPTLITLIYKVYQPIYYEMGLDHLVEDGPNLKQRLLNISKGQPMLIIFDDMINSNSLHEVANMFVVDGRHNNLSMIFISQKLFVNGENFRQISQNSDYYVIFKNPRNCQEIRNLASQMTPGKMQLISHYIEATKNPFSYLFINLTQECQPKVKYLSHLFNTTHLVNVYDENNDQAKHLTDDKQTFRTNFEKMKIIPNFETYDSVKNQPSSSNYTADVSDRKDQATSTNEVGMTDQSSMTYGILRDQSTSNDKPHLYNQSTSTDGIMSNQSTCTDKVGKRDQSTMTNAIMKDQATSMEKVNVRNQSTTTRGLMHDAATSFDKRGRNDQSTMTHGIMRDNSSSMKKPTNHNKSTTSMGIMTDSSTSTNYTNNRDISSTTSDDDRVNITSNTSFDQYPLSLPLDDADIEMDNEIRNDDEHETQPLEFNRSSSLSLQHSQLPSLQYSNSDENDIKMTTPTDSVYKDYAVQCYRERRNNNFFSRPERNLRLNTQIHDLIRQPITYREYTDYDNVANSGLRAITFDNQSSNENAKSFCCKKEFCNQFFRTQSALNQHQLMCKPNNFSCDVCGKTLATRNGITQHIKSMHQNRIDVRKLQSRKK